MRGSVLGLEKRFQLCHKVAVLGLAFFGWQTAFCFSQFTSVSPLPPKANPSDQSKLKKKNKLLRILEFRGKKVGPTSNLIGSSNDNPTGSHKKLESAGDEGSDQVKPSLNSFSGKITQEKKRRTSSLILQRKVPSPSRYSSGGSMLETESESSEGSIDSIRSTSDRSSSDRSSSDSLATESSLSRQFRRSSLPPSSNSQSLKTGTSPRSRRASEVSLKGYQAKTPIQATQEFDSRLQVKGKNQLRLMASVCGEAFSDFDSLVKSVAIDTGEGKHNSANVRCFQKLSFLGNDHEKMKSLKINPDLFNITGNEEINQTHLGRVWTKKIRAELAKSYFEHVTLPKFQTELEKKLSLKPNAVKDCVAKVGFNRLFSPKNTIGASQASDLDFKMIMDSPCLRAKFGEKGKRELKERTTKIFKQKMKEEKISDLNLFAKNRLKKEAEADAFAEIESEMKQTAFDVLKESKGHLMKHGMEAEVSDFTVMTKERVLKNLRNGPAKEKQFLATLLGNSEHLAGNERLTKEIMDEIQEVFPSEDAQKLARYESYIGRKPNKVSIEKIAAGDVENPETWIGSPVVSSDLNVLKFDTKPILARVYDFDQDHEKAQKLNVIGQLLQDFKIDAMKAKREELEAAKARPSIKKEELAKYEKELKELDSDDQYHTIHIREFPSLYKNEKNKEALKRQFTSDVCNDEWLRDPKLCDKFEKIRDHGNDEQLMEWFKGYSTHLTERSLAHLRSEYKLLMMKMAREGTLPPEYNSNPGH